MLIHEMTNQECLDTLARVRVGRLGCARDNQPYIVPIYFASHKRDLYAFATLGKKIEWMRANPRVCVEADEFTAHNQWMSVVAFGHYEEFRTLPNTSQSGIGLMRCCSSARCGGSQAMSPRLITALRNP